MFSRPVLLAISLSLLASLPVKAAPKWDTLLDKERAPFITALAQDKDGNIWIGTEDKGVFRCNPAADETLQWSQFTTRDGLGDDNGYAITCDRLGRIWVGTLNHGVSVFNGEKWKTYGVLEGPIGERIFALATCPTDGDVWMATSSGLSRYSVKDDTWTHYTRAEGLPSDQVNALAFSRNGDLYVGTVCDGITIARADGDYSTWTRISVPQFTGPVPLTPAGAGLPSNLINALLVSSSGTVYAATTGGLAYSDNKGKTWQYRRGLDYAAKVRGRAAGVPAGWNEAPEGIRGKLLPEDYVTCLAEDDLGKIWVGFRKQGTLVFDPKADKHLFRGDKQKGMPEDYVTTILPTGGQSAFCATYGGGLLLSPQAYNAPAKQKPGAKQPEEEKAPPFPSSAKPPTMEELSAKLAELAKLQAKRPTGPYAVVLPDDWRTQGDFYGEDKLRNYRYGEWHAHLCAKSSPFDAVWGRRPIPVEGWIGSHRTKDDSLRHWVHWKETDNRRSLKNPFQGGRRQADWDDHGEAYPLSTKGLTYSSTSRSQPARSTSPFTSSTRTVTKETTGIVTIL